MKKQRRTEIRFSGFGGQGIIKSALIAGRAAAIYDKKEAVVTQSYGPEARGGACSGTVIVDNEPIDYPYVTAPDILVVMSQEAYTTYRPTLKKDGMMLIDEDLVKLDKNDKALVYKIPATRFAEELGKKIVANVVMLGFFTSITGVTKYDSMKKAVLESVPQRFREINEKGFEKGYNYGKEIMKGKKET
ncbi:MAG: pyruvate ferredoxin oxidoreductase [Thermoplasmata archaeon]|nr:MAG: pyruvate ferredoxin oxidoreductase [Thermoplasmata archaeon]